MPGWFNEVDWSKKDLCNTCTWRVRQEVTVAPEDWPKHVAFVHGQDFLTVEEIRRANGAVGDEVAPDQKPRF